MVNVRLLNRAGPSYTAAMSVRAQELVSAFEALPLPEKLDVANAIFRRLPPVDSGPLTDDEVAFAGDDLAATLDREEHDARAR